MEAWEDELQRRIQRKGCSPSVWESKGGGGERVMTTLMMHTVTPNVLRALDVYTVPNGNFYLFTCDRFEKSPPWWCSV